MSTRASHWFEWSTRPKNCIGWQSRLPYEIRFSNFGFNSGSFCMGGPILPAHLRKAFADYLWSGSDGSKFSYVYSLGCDVTRISTVEGMAGRRCFQRDSIYP